MYTQTQRQHDIIKNQTGNKLDCIYNSPYKVLGNMSPTIKIWKNTKTTAVHKNNTKNFKT